MWIGMVLSSKPESQSRYHQNGSAKDARKSFCAVDLIGRRGIEGSNLIMGIVLMIIWALHNKAG